MLLSTDSTPSILFIILLLKTNINLTNSQKCNRTPDYRASRTPADGRFHIRILENTDRYTPGRKYTIKLEGIDAGQRTMPPLKHKFAEFFLVVEKRLDDSGLMDNSPSNVGTLTIREGDTLSKINCPNMATHTTTTPKSEIHVVWTAPQAGSGCVAFKATVIEHRDVWFMDDGPLTKEFCEEEQSLDNEFSMTYQCCVCSEAKYELTFEGLWSRNTHPKDFPTNNWITKFSDIIGASHSQSYRFWRYGFPASEGVRQVAELGATRALETELKSQSGDIRTIIKAKGLAFPNVTGKTFAVFRVDRSHSQVSFVSMIDPSPDWFLGVSGLELCADNCSWVENRTIDLYPYDAGTDSGPSYLSPNEETKPRDHIRRIRSDFPNDPRSPFYDPQANMKPLARLYISRQRLYEKECPEDTEDNDSNPGSSRRACAVTPWEERSPCDAECGPGNQYQQRQFLFPHLAMQANCKDELTRRHSCYGTSNCNDNSAEHDDTTESSCALTKWSEWSECSERCGHGKMYRSRKYVNKGMKSCVGGTNYPKLEEERPCYTPCSSEIGGDSKEPPGGANPEGDGEGTECVASEWNPYEDCSATCGGGIQTRTRELISGKCTEDDLNEGRPCNTFDCPVPSFCKKFPVRGDCNNVTLRWYYNSHAKRCDTFPWSCGGNKNKFETSEDCWRVCSEQTSVLNTNLEQFKRKGKKGSNWHTSDENEE